MITELTDQVDSLNGLVRSYRKKELPAKMLTMEICAQYNNISDVVISRGSSVDPQSGAIKETIVAIVSAKEALSDDELDRLRNWLSVRLEAEELIVLQR